MMKTKEYMKYLTAGLGALALISSCVSYSRVIKSEPVKNIPDKKYDTIIRLDTPDSKPMQPDAGFVYVEPGGKVKTDFPREVFVKTLDGLDKYEQLNRNNMAKFVIKDGKGKVHGYYEMLFEYRTIIWERDDDILLQVIIPRGMRGSIDDAGVGLGGMAPKTGGGGK